MATPTIKYTVNYNQSYFRKTKGNTNKVKENLRIQGRKFIEDVHARAVREAPVLTSELRRHIHIRQQVNGGKNSFMYEVYTTNPTEGGNNQLWPYANNRGEFDLIRWMHSTDGVFRSNNPFGRAGTRHIKSGNPRFMMAAKDYAREKSDRYFNKKALKRGLVT